MAVDSPARPPMIRWLEKNELDDVVKDTLTVPFGKGEGDDATKLAEYLADEGYQHSRLRTVNPQTLKALIRELRDRKTNKISIPYDDLGIQVGKRAALK